MRALPTVVVAILLLLGSVTAAGPAGVPSAAGAGHGAGTSHGAGPNGADRLDPAASLPARLASSLASSTRIAPSQTDDANFTLRTMSTPLGADARVSSSARGADLGSAVGFATAEADAAVETAAVVQRVERAGTNAERQRRILAEINRVERQEVSLRGRQTDAFAAHADGELTDRELVDELVRVAATADKYDERLDELDALAGATEGFSSPSRLDALQVALQAYRGPVRDHALSTARAESAANDVYVASSRNAVVLAAVVDGQYVREVFRADHWDRGAEPISNDEAIDAIKAAYPETAALREPDAFGAGSVQRITIPHEFGTLRAFVSGGTRRAFAEHQRIDLAAFPDREPVTETGDGFEVTVERTYPGGPVTVTVLDEETGSPVSGVTVTKSVADGDSRAIGETDENGAVRTLSPAETYRITVIDEPRVVVLDELEPLGTPRPVEAAPTDSA